jgi:hypothetical protein
VVSKWAKGAPTADIGVPDFAWGQWGQGLLSDWWETSPELIWPQSVVTFGRMRHDPQIKGVLGAFLFPLLRANWAIDPGGCKTEVVQTCADDMGLPILGDDPKPTGARRRGVIWGRHIRQALIYQIYGYSLFERRYRIDPNGMCRLDNLGQRMPWTVAMMNLNKDATIDTIQQSTQHTPIPASRLVWYVSDQEGANWAGISPLRSCYAPWLLKHETWRVHATSIRRFGMGIPTVTAPAGATVNQVTQAQQLASAMRAGDSAGVGLPQGFKYELAGMVGSIPDPMAFIQYLDQQISRQALAGLMDLATTPHGSRALGETFLDFFLLSLKSLADEIALVATSGWPTMPGIVTDLVDMNWGPDEPAPQVVCPDLGANYELTEDVIAKLVQYGAIDPDPGLDSFLRKRWGIPQRDPNAPSKIPPPGPPDAPKPIPANEDDPAVPGAEETGDPAPEPGGKAPSTAIASGPGGNPATAGALGTLRRKLSPVEAKAGFEPLTVRQELTDALTALMAAVKTQALDPLRDQIAGQVAAAVHGGRLGDVASLTPDTGILAGLVAEAMAGLAQTAADRMRGEAATQGVSIPSVLVADPRLEQVAAARAGMLGAYLTQQAASRALQVSAADAPAPGVAGKIEHTSGSLLDFLTGLSDRSLTDQLGAALSAAVNTGRSAAMAAAPDDAGPVQYASSEILDDNCCGPCRDEDGTVFASLDDADAAYPVGAYIGCDGGARCRGVVVALWGGE